ncbi:MAG TPA: ATP-binding cassette domain-containing protein, partial [Thermoanaerobaculia bacterium]|nr:ATP-binding cassette domain-containing protein [Thermoanaerobaculia bacterium]
MTNLYEVRNKAVSTFSGGMKQRFGIAQALLGAPSLIIVDEPTAGLDPEERSRFHNLLSELGENAVVLLSTHIVEDVSDLCPRMALLAGGRVVLQGEPARLIAELEGRLWRKAVPKPAVAGYRASHDVIAARLFAGQAQVYVLADGRPEPGFEPAAPDLEDVYFSVLSSLQPREERIAC